MRESSSSPFAVWAGISLAIHVGLAFSVAIGARRTQEVEARSASGSSSAEHGSAAIGGETFDIAEEMPPLEAPPVEESASDESPSASESSGAPAETTRETIELDEKAAKRAAPRASSRAPSRAHAASANASNASNESAPPPMPLYGAVGERGSIDLVFAFKRAFPQGASSDPIWDRVPIGFFAEGDVTFTIDAAGTLTHTTVSANAAPAFRAAIARTVAVIKGRPFTAKGATTRLHMIVRVNDQLQNGGRFMIDAAGSFDLPSGRHVGVSIAER